MENLLVWKKKLVTDVRVQENRASEPAGDVTVPEKLKKEQDSILPDNHL